MAKVFLDANESFTLSSPADVFGSTGTEKVLINSISVGDNIASTVERVELSGALASYTFAIAGTQLTIRSGTTVVATLGVAAGQTLAFADGSAALNITGLSAGTLGGVALPTAAAAVVAPLNTADKSAVAVGAVAPVVGQAFALTSNTVADSLVLTSGNDTVTGGAGTLTAGDIVIDTSSTDSDVLNLTMNAADVTAALTPTISKVEAVNINFDVLSGAALNLASVTGATVTGSSSKFGFNGALTLFNPAANSVKAGTSITNLTVSGLTTGKVDLGAATTASIATALATDSATITANGNVASLTVATTTKTLTINSATDTTLTFAAGATTDSATIITGVAAAGKKISLTGDVGTVQGKTISGIDTITLNADAAASTTTDATKWGTSKIVAAANLGTENISHADAAVVTVGANQTLLTLTGTSAVTGTVDVTVGTGIGTLTKLVLANDKTAAIKLSDAITISTLDTSAVGTTNLAIAGDTVISALAAGTKSVVVTGTGNLTATAASVAGSVDASAMTGILAYTQSAAANTSVKGGTGNNTVVFAGTTHTSSYSDSGTTGNDTVTFVTTAGSADATFAGGTNSLTAAALTSGSLAVIGGIGADTVTVGAGNVMNGATVISQLGEGNDTVSIAGTFTGASTLNLDFGNGTDTLKLADTLDLSSSTVTLAGLENIAMQGTTATLAAATVSGKVFTIAGTAGMDTLTIAGKATGAQTIDASTLSIGASLEAVSISGGSGIDTIKGNGNVTVNGGAGADIITASVGGSDQISIKAGTTAGGGDSGTFAVPLTNTINTTGFDVIAGLVAGDTVKFNAGYTGTTGQAVGLIADGVAANTLVGLTIADNTLELVRGTYTQATNAFVGSATGTDTLFVYDSAATLTTGNNNQAYEAIVLVGYVAASVTGIGGNAGLVTLG